MSKLPGDYIGNLGVSLGASVGGFFISKAGISIIPRVGIVFGIMAILVIIWRSYLDKHHQEKSTGNLDTMS